MAKVSPARTSFNGGEFSQLVYGRTDTDRYPASMRKLSNFIVTPQGPAIRRSGTYFVCEAYANDTNSALVPFIFNDDQSLQVEAANERFRFVLENGLQVYTDRNITDVVALNPLQIDSVDLDAAVGDQVVLNGFPSADNINFRTVTITAKVGTVYTLDYDYSIGTLGAPATAATAALVYSIAAPYLSADVQNIRYLQSLDTVYLFCDGYKPRKLIRRASYDWEIATLLFDTGPFMPQEKKMGTLTLSGTGRPTTGGTASASTGTAANAFDGNKSTYWESTSNQAAWVQYQFATARVMNGYVIVPGKANDNTSYASLDYAPGDFNLFGSNDGATWYLLDAQAGYVLYDNGRSALFDFSNTTAYSYYRFEVTACTRNGPIPVRVSELIFKDEAETNIDISLAGTYDNVNYGDGFKATDVGRLVRCKGSDQSWRILRIKTFTDATHVTATLISEPFLDTAPVLEWQLGYWSDTTGWPSCGTFFEDRMFVGGTGDAPDLVSGSRTGAYEDFLQRTADNEVLDDSAIVIRMNSRRLSGIRWLATDERGLLLGTGSNEYVVSPSNTDNALSARNIKARSSTDRGSASMEPAKIDRQVLYVQASQRTVREYAYVYEADGYKSPSMSLFASHLGVKKFKQMAYAGEPHSIIWFRREDGTVVALTYNREENVIGWHRHDFGGVVESISVIPSATDLQDTLWMVVKRTINNVEVRYIERLMRFWDFDSVVTEAHFVDCGLRYSGAYTNTLYGLFHLEGETVQGLRNGIPFEGLTVTDGKLELPDLFTTAIVGKQFVSEAEISRIDAGGADGTSQGKEKRTHGLVIELWQSAYGELGKWNDDKQETEWRDVEYRERFSELEPITLQDGLLGPHSMPSGYGKTGSLSFRQTKPLPFNVIAMYPQLYTQDRG